MSNYLIGDDTISIVVNNDCIALRVAFLQVCEQAALTGLRKGRARDMQATAVVALIQAHDVLSIGDDTRLLQSTGLLILHQPAVSDIALAQGGTQKGAGTISTGHPEQRDTRPQRPYVRRGIGCSAGK